MLNHVFQMSLNKEKKTPSNLTLLVCLIFCEEHITYLFNDFTHILSQLQLQGGTQQINSFAFVAAYRLRWQEYSLLRETY